MAAVEERKVKALSRMVHEHNKAFCESRGDFSQKPWSEAPGYNHQSAMVAVRAICENPKLTPEDVHDIWMDTKKADGWVYGETKDYDKKTHPSIVPFADLSTVEKFKDHIVISTVLNYLQFLDIDGKKETL